MSKIYGKCEHCKTQAFMDRFSICSSCKKLTERQWVSNNDVPDQRTEKEIHNDFLENGFC